MTINKYPWVFWFNIKIRTKWFSYFWKARGANYLEIQFLCFYISIGRPWSEYYLETNIRDYGNLNSIKKTNDSFPQKWYYFHIGEN